jgi:gliding motility-associated-like protein
LNIKLLIVSVLFIAATCQLRAQREGYSNLEFVQNKGQWDKSVLFRGELSNGAFFLQKQGFTVLLHNANDLKRLTDNHHGLRPPEKQEVLSKAEATASVPLEGNGEILHSHAYSVTFLGADTNPVIIPDKALPSYNNYFIGNDPSQWAPDCKIYQAVTYQNIYPGIDIRYYTSNGQLKYDVIVHPGANPDQISLQYKGLDKINIQNKQLLIKTSVGDVQELVPEAYQLNEKGRTETPCKYKIIHDNIVKFKIKNYSPGLPLIIDPTLVFCTFTGSRASNWGFTATPGPDGSFYAGGIVFGAGFPTSLGAFQRNFIGGEIDVGIMKFSSNGSNRVYATYLGGSGNETPHSLICDPQGDLIVLGRTYSADFPIKSKQGPGGGADIFVAKLSPGGDNLIGSMRIGGSKDDGVNIQDQFKGGSAAETAISLIRNYGDDSRSEVVLDGSGNIYVASCTQSVSDFPVSAGAFQTTFGGGSQDGVVLKIDPGCSNLLFASFLGGSKEDAAFVLTLKPGTGEIYVAGATASGDFPGNKTNVIQGAYQGGICDGYVTVISNDGSVQGKTSYLGTSLAEAIYGIQFDKMGFPYIMGSTTGVWPIINAAYGTPGTKQFIAKLEPDLSKFIYSTTFGYGTKQPNISPVAFLVDRCENVYVSGWGGWIFARADPYGLAGTLGMPYTPNAIKKNTDGRDFYFIVIQKNAASLIYATFFGQTDGPQSISEHVDGGTSRYDQNGVIYEAICANCGDRSITPFPTTIGVWSRRNGTIVGGTVTGCNLAAVKIAFDFAGVSAGLKAVINGKVDSSGCVPLDALLMDTVRSAKSYIWTFGDGTPDSITSNYQVSHIYNLVGNYRVRLIAIDSNSCNISDTVYMTIRGRTDKAQLAFTAVKQPPCQSLIYLFSNLSTAPSSKPFTSTSFIWDFGDNSTPLPSGTGVVSHPYASPGTYIVRLLMVDTNYCNYPDTATITLRIAPLVKALFETPATGCIPYNAVFNNTSLAGQQFIWDFGDGSPISTQPYPTHVYPNTGVYLVRLTVIDSSTCNISDSTSFTITVNPNPKAAFTDAPIPPQPNVQTVFFNNSIGATHYTWFFGDGDSAIKSTMDTVRHQYQESGSFQACLVAYNQFECPDTACSPIQTIVNPLLDVPNAFTPGRFGQNGIIKVQSFGIASMLFRIYNRWGQKVFETNDPNQGWDGTFNGVLQPMDVYAYTLEAQFFDGTKTTRKGDITLIR